MGNQSTLGRVVAGLFTGVALTILSCGLAACNPQGSSTTGSSSKTGAYAQDGDVVVQSGETYSAANEDESAVYVYGGGRYTLTGSNEYSSATPDAGTYTLTKTGDTTSEENSNFYGQNAIVLAEAASQITLSDCVLHSSASGANGAFAYGESSKVALSNCWIITTGDSSRGVDATYGGTVSIADSSISTQGAHCAALASDRYDSTAPTIIADNVSGTTAGDGSPGIYCTGTFTVSHSALSATGSEAAAIEGLNSISLIDSSISGARKWGVLLYQSTSGDSATGTCTFSMTGGTLTNNSTGPVFMVCDTGAVINLEGVTINNAGGSGVLLRATRATSGDANINSSWGTLGGTVVLNATSQTLTGAFTRYSSASSITLNLKSGSTWNMTADSTVDSLTVEAGAVVNKNGHTLTCTSLTNNGGEINS